MVREVAYAKINLALHVRRRRSDGYHDLETVFAFCDRGDALSIERSTENSLIVKGPFAAAVPLAGNIVEQAVETFSEAFDIHEPRRVLLEKALPVAAGVGGGSADAAATLRALARLYAKHDADVLGRCAATLGADVPACLASQTARGEGIGHDLTAEPSLTGTPVLLVNPRIALSTAAVFAGWNGIDRGPLLDWRDGRNDLEAPARTIVPEIADVLDLLRAQAGASLVRMSGSGATCFALFDGVATRDLAQSAATAFRPGWWSMASTLR